MRVGVRWVAVVAALVVVVLGVVLVVQHKPETSVPRLAQEHANAPAMSLTTLDGKTVDFANAKGKTTVVNFWNTWCIPCRQEAPELDAFWGAHKGDKSLAMVGVVRDDDESAVRTYVDKEKVGWQVAMDPDHRAAIAFGTTGQPETYVISPSGVIACGTLGPATQAQLEQWVEIASSGQVCA